MPSEVSQGVKRIFTICAVRSWGDAESFLLFLFTEVQEIATLDGEETENMDAQVSKSSLRLTLFHSVPCLLAVLIGGSVTERGSRFESLTFFSLGFDDNMYVSTRLTNVHKVSYTSSPRWEAVTMEATNFLPPWRSRLFTNRYLSIDHSIWALGKSGSGIERNPFGAANSHAVCCTGNTNEKRYSIYSL